MTSDANQIEDGEQYSNVRFRGVRAAEVRFREVQFSDCTFDHCRFTGAEFSRCSFTGCTFRTCDLSLVRVAGTRFMDVGFIDTKLIGVDWTTIDVVARLALSVEFERCVLSQAAFNGLNLRRLRLVDSVAQETDFTNADLADAVFTGTDLSGARFADTTLAGADFRSAHGYRINPLINRVAKARFSLPDAMGLLDGLGVIVE